MKRSALLWIAPVLLTAALAMGASGLGSGGIYGLVEYVSSAFTGDLATDNVLQDSSDNEIDIGPAQLLKWTGETTLDCATDGICNIKNNAGNNGTLTLGGSGTSVRFAPVNATDGTVDVRVLDNSAGGGIKISDPSPKATGWFADSGNYSQIGLDMDGMYGWGNSTTSDLISIGLCGDGSSGGDVVYTQDNNACPNAFAGNATGSFAFGYSATTLPTCDANRNGAWEYEYSTASVAAPVLMCRESYDGSSTTYRWAAPGGLGGNAHAYISTPNTSVSITDNTLTSIDDATIAYTTTLLEGFSWSEPLLTVIKEGAGWYEIAWSVTFAGDAANTYEIGVCVNLNEGAGLAWVAGCYNTIATGDTAYMTTGGPCYYQIADADGTNNDSVGLCWKRTVGSDAGDIGNGSITVKQR